MSAPQLTAARFDAKSPTASKNEEKESPSDASGTAPSLGRAPRERASKHDARVGPGHRQPHVDQRDQPAAGGPGVHRRGEAGDDAVPAQAPDAVGRGVGAEADGGTEVAEGDAPVAHELTEDLAVSGIHPAIVAGSTGQRWRNSSSRATTQR